MGWLAMLSILLGAAAGSTVSARAAETGHWYMAEMIPPAGSLGQSPTLNCGWHTGACDDPGETGINLDWGPTTTTNVYFRGWFTRTGSDDNETTRLTGRPTDAGGGQYACENRKVDVIENFTGVARFAMHYLHINLNSTADFAIKTGNAAGNDRAIGYMLTSDAGCTGYSGQHVHESHALNYSVQANLHSSLYPAGDYCIPAPCTSYANYAHARAMRWFWWKEGI